MEQGTGQSSEERVKEIARVIGFDAVRITTPEAPGHNAHFFAWLEAGMHATMEWLRNRAELRSGRLDDERLLAGTRSVIVLATSYHSKDNVSRETLGAGVVARYARGTEDYHNVLREMLNALADAIAAEFPGERSRGFVDSGPIRERELASRAGLGWQGKHTNLISLDLGNFFFLSALLTTLPLKPDPPFTADHCGTCTRCLAACPTGALPAPRTLDARRCISYLTIEHRGSIPLELRPLMGNRIFGCDDCLAACPWNERAIEGHQARLVSQGIGTAYPDLLELLANLETEEGFRTRFRGTPLLRPKREGLRRNVCIALGNVGTVTTIPALEQVVSSDASEVVREAALWAITRITERFT